ncbi:MAG: glycosyltransferase family 39 protein [Coleofasciculus sp. G3-WIS-01]|uniref:glycosyltransferase family 39 protein n=1 Tax=Coleofasciculus sp. G3-WIS-01 TaxID=3069528 RepID=UPI0033032B42
MNRKSASFWNMPPAGVRFLIIVLLIIGVFFRFYNIDKKVYWHDESFTSMRISGYSKPELKERLFDGRIITVEDIQKYQRPNPEKNLTDTIKVLTQYSEHTPLYYLIARFWAQVFGSSVAVMRSLPALISLLAFPCMYWLCRELFGSSLTGWMAMSLIAISPFFVLYAQEAREYSLWAVAVLLSGAALLRALRINTKLGWGIYAATLTIGLYSHLLFGLSAIGHGIYVLITKNYRTSKTIIAYLLASLAAVLTFLPWAVVIFIDLTRFQRWTSSTTSRNSLGELVTLIKWWLRNLNNVFFDLHQSIEPFDPIHYDDPFLIPLVLILVGYSIYFLCRHTSSKVWLFILTWMGMTALPLVLLDLVLGGLRSTAMRYLIPIYLAIQIAVAYLLATKITAISIRNQRQRFWKLVTIGLVSGGLLSCAISSSAEVWWTKFVDYYNPPVAHIINQANYPLVVSDTTIPGSILSLSHLLSPDVRFQLVTQASMLEISEDFNQVFLFDASTALREKIERELGGQFEVAFQGYKFELWKLENNKGIGNKHRLIFPLLP